MKIVSVTAAARNLSALVKKLHDRGESALLVKRGKPLVRVSAARQSVTGRELARVWPKLPHLTPAEAAAFEYDLAEAREHMRRPSCGLTRLGPRGVAFIRPT